MATDAEAGTPLLEPEGGPRAWELRRTFAASLAGLLALLLGLLSVFGKYADMDDAHVAQYYSFFTDVYVMIFLGFGFLMTFLKRYSYTAVALNFAASCLVVLEATLVLGWAQQGWAKGGAIAIDLPLLIDAAFAAGAAMISLGAWLGKATPCQAVWLLAAQVPLYAANAQLVAGVWGALDVGGSITIHAFGAVYGVAASYWLSPRGAGSRHPKNGASYASDITAMLGTLFLFIYWPSFNAALASAPDAKSQPQALCILNTVLALLGACLAAFAASAAAGGKLDMVHVQNATLAGGVAIGSSANLAIPPAAALAVGITAGALSTAGYLVATPALEARAGITDTCGVANLHGLPGIWGGLASALFSWLFRAGNKHVLAHGAAQPGVQLAALAATLGAAAVGGWAAGWVVSWVDCCGQALAEEQLYEDAVFWHEVEEDGKEE